MQRLMNDRCVEEDATRTVTVLSEEAAPETSAQDELVLRLRAADDAAPRVRWATNTVDNEHLGKKKSKCCCIYKKQRKWDESSSSSDSDCETGNCRGHVEKKRHPHAPENDGGGNIPSSGAGDSSSNSKSN